MTPTGEWWLAVDFGTSFTTSAMAVDDRIEVLEIDNSRYMPSTVCLDADGEVLVGRYAVNEAVIRPSAAERLPKQALAKTDQTRLGGITIETVDLVAAVLRQVAEEARRRRGDREPSRVVLTHPARWQQGGAELRRLTEAAARAGLPRPELVAEPVAAAHHYVHATGADVPLDSAIGVYDLGGGTFDTAVLRRSGKGFELAGPPGGDLHLGGEDLDEELLSLVESHAQARDASAWTSLMEESGRDAERQRAHLRTDVTTAKEALSRWPSTRLYVPGYDSELRLTRPEYEEVVRPVLERSVVEMVDTIMKAGCTPQSLRDLYLVGGSSRTPLITSLLSSLLHRVPTTEDDPKAVVVQGALRTDPKATPRPPDEPIAEVARELTAVAAKAGVGDLVGIVVPDPYRDPVRQLREVVDEIGVAIARRFSPFKKLPVHVGLQLLREGRSELGELGWALTRLDRLGARLDAMQAPGQPQR